jgi:hypothetical protein
MNLDKSYLVSAAYEWPKHSSDKKARLSQLAIKTLVANVQTRLATLSKKTKNPIKVNYRRLRASAGGTLLEGIMKRIMQSNALVIDISSDNRNVHIEMGIALMHSKLNPEFRLYLIRHCDSSAENQDSPSDIQGYFVTEYNYSQNKIVFKDNGSLLMSMVGDIVEYNQQHGNNELLLDEISTP